MGLLKFLEWHLPNKLVGFGAFHLVSLLLVIVATVLLIVYFKDCDEKTFKRIALIGWIIMLSFEIYKQFVSSYSIDENGVITWAYEWHRFPFQLCSMPLYVLPFVIFMKEASETAS